MSEPDLSWFWSIVDKEKFAAVPSDEREALVRILAERDAAYERGAADMRERAARAVGPCSAKTVAAIRALPHVPVSGAGMTLPPMMITATGPQGCGKSKALAAIQSHLVALGCEVQACDDNLHAAGTHALRVTAPGNAWGGVWLAGAAPTDRAWPLPAPPSNSAEAAQAEAWRVLLAWAADAPPRYRQALATLLEMLAHARPNSHSADAIKAGAARLNAVTTKEALE